MTDLTIVPYMGGNLDYDGANDPRWSDPQMLVWSDTFNLILPMEAGQTTPSADQHPASLEEIRDVYSPKPSQHILSEASSSGENRYWVTNAIYRQPCKEPSILSPLPLRYQITPEEMDILGPWLRLTQDTVCDDGKNPLDSNLQDGIDNGYKTFYNWNDLQSVTELFLLLENFQKVKRGEIENPREWPTDFDEARLQALIDQTKTRSQELFDQQPHKPTSWEEFASGCRVGLGFALAGSGVGIVGWGAIKLYGRFMAKRALAAGVAAAADGPLPAGEVIGTGILLFSVGEFLWNYDKIAGEI